MMDIYIDFQFTDKLNHIILIYCIELYTTGSTITGFQYYRFVQSKSKKIFSYHLGWFCTKEFQKKKMWIKNMWWEGKWEKRLVQSERYKTHVTTNSLNFLTSCRTKKGREKRTSWTNKKNKKKLPYSYIKIRTKILIFPKVIQRQKNDTYSVR